MGHKKNVHILVISFFSRGSKARFGDEDKGDREKVSGLPTNRKGGVRRKLGGRKIGRKMEGGVTDGMSSWSGRFMGWKSGGKTEAHRRRKAVPEKREGRDSSH